jgi:hypothetical protein
MDKGLDWRKKLEEMIPSLASEIPDDARGLGAMEGNISNVFADRMKDQALGQSLSKE